MTRNTRTLASLVAACMAVLGSVHAQTAPAAADAARVAQAASPEAMQRLQQSADRLRESIQALAQKSPGPQRDHAIAMAHEALLQTQQAMISLPPEMRAPATSGAVAGYDKTVRNLMQSADSLRGAVQEMARHEAGARRNQAIRDANQALWDTQQAMASAHSATLSSAGPNTSASMGSSGAARAGSEGSRTANAGAAQAGGPAVLVLLPQTQAAGNQLANGCWVRFFDDKSFRGDALTLAGPVDMPRMDLPGKVWRDWDSAVVGPKATVVTYDNENFRDRTATLRPGQSVADLRDQKLGWFEEVKSARVACG